MYLFYSSVSTGMGVLKEISSVDIFKLQKFGEFGLCFPLNGKARQLKS